MEKVSEVKLAKFGLILKDTGMYLLHTRKDIMHKDEGYASMPFRLPVTDDSNKKRYDGNAYYWEIISNVACRSKPNLDGYEGFDWSYYNKLKKELEALRKADNNYETPTIGTKYGEGRFFNPIVIRNGIIFWSLLMAAVDENFYKKAINLIADLACIFEFNEDMMSDWIEAVKYLLDGNKFSENMTLEFKTPEANLFFKHIGNEEKTPKDEQTTEVGITDLIKSLGALNS
jgi:hypothetical protein